VVNRHSRRRPSDPPRPVDGRLEEAPGGTSASRTDAVLPAGLPVVAGYRVLRTLSSGERADILLGHAPLGSSAQAAVAIKVFRHDADPASVEREIAALSDCRPGCLPRLIDVGALADGRVLMVMERLGGGTVGSLLLRRSSHLHPGEVVTVIAPVIVALAAVHTIGFVHSTLSPGTVTLDEDGRPVLTGLGGLLDLPPFGPRGEESGDRMNSRLDDIRSDYARLTVFMRAVFDRLDRTTPAARQSEFLAAWFEGATSAVPFHPCLDELERRLFEWAPAAPLRRERDDAHPSSRVVPGRVVLRGPEISSQVHAPGDGIPDADSSSVRPTGRARRLPGWLAILHLPEDLASTVVGGLDVFPVASVVTRARNRFMAKRRAMIIAGCVAAATTVAALTVLPVGGMPADHRRTESGAPTSQAEPVAAATSNAPDPTARAAITGDDPVAAIPHLLAARSACLTAAHEDCLAGSDQAGSPILAADLHRARNLHDGGGVVPLADYARHTAVLIERTGDSALVALEPGVAAEYNEPASLLVIKGEAGWRLREIFKAMETSTSPG
jgi:eukaryotic-like serine/threonine-protein kinase